MALYPAVGPLLLAHRGSSQPHVENTLPAFAHALACGADVLELDVQLSADAEVIVSHDATGLRLAGVDRPIAATTLAELKTWQLRSPDSAATPGVLATLSEVLEAFPETALNVDIKQQRPDMLPALLALLQRHRAEARVLLTSFSARTLWGVRRAGYAGPVGLSQLDAVRVVLGPRWLTRWLGTGGVRLQIPTRFAGLDLTTHAVLERAHAFSLSVDYWVVNELEEAQRLLDRGADGIVSDECGRMARLFAQHARAEGYRARHAGIAAAADGG